MKRGTTMELKELVTGLNSMILQGNALEAFERYYAEDVVMQENELTPTIGKDANRKREKEFFSNVVEFRGADVKAVAIGDGVSMVEWFFDYTHKDWGRRAYHQVAVQRWKDGKIVHERFYYGS
jgi:ketosteroid isomerase-like protein